MRYDYHGKYISIDLIEQWTQFFDPKMYNWLDFTFVNLYFEADRMHGMMEIETIVLGLGIRIYWTYDKKKQEESFEKYKNIAAEKDWISL